MRELDPREAASAVLTTANANATAALLLEVAVKLGVTEIDGVPLNDWHQRRKIQSVESQLRNLESRIPKEAAEIRAILTDAFREIYSMNNS